MISSAAKIPKLIRVTNDAPVKPAPVSDLTYVASTTTRMAKNATTREETKVSHC